ncbi:hypothetical protein V6x_28330 [Gimesia chilikensis]|uniref:Uncharacterized protein n=1 Tax=Gimesia chilikensis TaxID=2605989 RepID=A0A517WCY6_9PLAN|nr:hypothetical protein [Gimesia chilikensis]QDU03121.1 hypothetical protein V6x_28330 [Gimesia chilikensis]
MADTNRYPGGFHLKLSDLIPDREIDPETIKRVRQSADRSLREAWERLLPKSFEPSDFR